MRFHQLVTASLVGVAAAAGATNRPPPAEVIPGQAAACLELYEPARLLDPLLAPAFAERLASLPVYAQATASPQFREFVAAIRHFESVALTNWQTAARTLTRSGLAFAVGSGHRALLVVDGDDAAMLERLHSAARQIAVAEAEKRGQADLVRSAEHAGARGWSFNGQEAHAIVGNRLLAASDVGVLKAALDLRTGEGGGSLARRPDYLAARKAVGAGAVGMLFVDLAQLRQAPGFLNGLDAPADNPLLALLLAGVPANLKAAPWLALGIYLERQELSVRAFLGGDTPAGGASAFAQPAAGAPATLPCLRVPRGLASLSLYRDLAGFYAAKDELFPQRTSGLIFFENMMGIFFSGRNLTEEVLAQLKSQVRLIVARQEFDPAVGTPEPQLPGFALVLGLRDPRAFGEVMEEAWQKALGLVNFTRGQKAQPGLILDRVNHAGTTITVARFSAQDVPDRAHLDQRFNFRPALALAHGYAVLSSTEQLARDLVDALGKETATAAGASHTLLELDGSQLAAILKANRATLVRGDMVKTGKSQAEAEQGIDLFCGLMGWSDRGTLRLGDGKDGCAAELRLGF